MVDLEKLDCADHACVFKHNGPGGMRTNGGSCRCQPRKIKAYYEKLLEQVRSEHMALPSEKDAKQFSDAEIDLLVALVVQCHPHNCCETDAGYYQCEAHRYAFRRLSEFLGREKI